MEAGYDYLLRPGRLRHRLFKYFGIITFVFGALLLASGGAYYGYAANARADLDNLNVVLPGAVISEDKPQNIGAGLESSSSSIELSEDPDIPKVSVPAKVLPRLSMLAINANQLYPGEALSAGSWSNPWSYEPLTYQTRLLLEGFTPIEPSSVAPAGALDAATRLIMPSIGIDSNITELQILNLGESRAYETPDRVVGHISDSANAGEAGSSWFFGHTESLTMGEGAVFFNLRQVPAKLRDNEDVYIITETEETRYLYLVTSSQVVHQDDMALYETGQSTIHLVSCVPRLVYDHRLIVTGELVAQKIKS